MISYLIHYSLASLTFEFFPQLSAQRELVVQRKIIGTLRNEKGTFIYETLPTLIATWEQRGLDLNETLSSSLNQAQAKENVKKVKELNTYVNFNLLGR